jgi:hypothetical protein
VVRTDVVATGTLLVLGAFVSVTACSTDVSVGTTKEETNPTCLNGVQDDGEAGVDCGGPCAFTCEELAAAGDPRAKPSPTNKRKDGLETDVDCGGPDAPKCAEGKSCETDSDCTIACNYAKKCVSAPSCKPHLGGDTCGFGEVGESDAQHESCCRSLPVSGYTDPNHPDEQVFLDKYEITAGRIRAWIEELAKQYGGQPNVKGWIEANRPALWNPAWDAFLPTDYEGGTIIIGRRLLGDPRPEDNGWTGPPGPGVVLPPPTDQEKRLGVNYQFGPEVYVDLHGMNCGTFAGSFGFPTYWNPPDVLTKTGEVPRADGTSATGKPIPAKDLLDVKSMNCITNVMLAAFCAWDGGQLATDEVLDYVTTTPKKLGNISGCGTQYDNHGELLKNIFTNTVQTGGTCADVRLVNATFDAGDTLPVAGSPLNEHNYWYPDLGNVTHDKSWQISAPGRASTAANGQVDLIRLRPTDEPWMDLHGNMNEAVLDTSGSWKGLFGLKYRGIAYGSSRSDLNATLMKGESILRIQRPEAKAGYTGGRCMRFR